MEVNLPEAHDEQEIHGPEPSHGGPVAETYEPIFKDEPTWENECEPVPEQTQLKQNITQP